MPASYPELRRVHGGPDGLGVPLHDFSSNSNACGPCPQALAAVQDADACRYPDPGYRYLRAQLAEFHGVDVGRVVLAASASEFIFRITSLVARQGAERAGVAAVWLPAQGYGDYAAAVQAHGLAAASDAGQASLCWLCEPSSPLGAPQQKLPLPSTMRKPLTVLDRAYEPLRLSGAATLTKAQLQMLWQLWTPNKALGLTGVRAAYAIAPVGAESDAMAMESLCPSWPVGAHGVAMLQAWTQAGSQAWLAASRHMLRDWKAQQIALCASIGWMVLPSDANFFVCRDGPDPQPMPSGKAGGSIVSATTALRGQGIKVRDCASFGLPGHVRLSVQRPEAQAALLAAWQCITRART